jgi:hypothetical protein
VGFFVIYIVQDLKSHTNAEVFVCIVLFIDFAQLILGYKWITESEEDSLEFDEEKASSHILL